MDDNEDGIVPVFTMKAVIMQAGLQDDEVMQARIKRLEAEVEKDVWVSVRSTPEELVHHYCKLRQIIANAYQVAGAHDVPEHILDVLADPEDATEEQIDAMLPYHAQQETMPAVEGERARDNCELCHGEKGGVLGNENIVGATGGIKVCDYCHADGSADKALEARAAQPVEKAMQSLTDEQIHEIMSKHVDCDYSDGVAFARAILAAAIAKADQE